MGAVGADRSRGLLVGAEGDVMARYQWGYSDETFSTLTEARAALQGIVEEYLSDNHLDLLLDRSGRAVKEIEVTVRLRDH